jgi:LacI family transcriptional regulator
MTEVRRVTIKEVAEEADVAASTVSLVMNGKGYVRPATRARVLEAAQRLDYVPAHAARALAGRRTGNIGFILREDHFTRSEPFYTRVFLGAEFGARTTSVYVLLATVPGKYDPVFHRPRFLRERSVDGVIIAGAVSPEVIADVKRLEVPFVLVDFESGSIPSVTVDNVGGATSAVRHLIENGHRRIGFVGADMEHPSLRSRLVGYRSTMFEAGLPACDDLFLAEHGAPPTRETGARLAHRLLALDDRPTAVFCGNDALALGLVDVALVSGLRIPDDLCVVGFDDVAGASSAPVALSSVRVFTEQLGELGLRRVLELVEGDGNAEPSFERGSHVVTVPTELAIRTSSAFRRRQ